MNEPQPEQVEASDVAVELARLARANEALTRANRALEAFTYLVSHDLKEPARALGEYSRQLQEDHTHALDADGKDLVRRCLASSLHLQTLLTGLLEYSRAAQIRPDDLSDIRMEDVIHHADCLTRYEVALGERHGVLEVEPGVPVRASMQGLCQVVGNLILNALKHNAAPVPSVRIRTQRAMDPLRVEVLIDDNGPGYPEGLVERFNHADQTYPMTLRGGFGMTIAREATQKMGGEIRLARAPEGGARAILTLHAARSAL